MSHRIIETTLIAAALLLSANPSLADKKPEAPDTSAGSASAPEKGAIRQKPAAPAKNQAAAAVRAKWVDINSAGKTELKTLPGVGDAEADKIIAGRPYLSKANLLSHDIVSRKTYEGLKSRVIAKPNEASAAKLEQMKKGRQ